MGIPSLPMRERELKLLNEGRQVILDVSLPMRERELKLEYGGCYSAFNMSLPMRERELKLPGTGLPRSADKSLPMRKRVREAGLLCPRAVRYCRAAAGVAVSHQHRTEK